ncbi:unnamed protein product [Parascedosporium putredinis]|uniref:Nitrogen permease regulator 3 n=1 Tax=Parascedosporium putredinis TaxID=1442378 RepID=A0A9P1H0F7_9PEZI|nr:unnamed protein product [Parascedosporium putredinis]CAI7992768.1 unnamed protein product [Parascedosporium putredinis]
MPPVIRQPPIAMSLPVLPNPSNLVGVALVVNRTRDGPSLVFHYPPEIASEPIGQASADSLDEGLAQDDILLERLLKPERSHQPQGQGFHPGRGREDRLISNSGSQTATPGRSRACPGGGPLSASELKQPAADEEEKVSSMTMFNVVFILNPKTHEVNDLVHVIYTHITKKVNKAYKYCQQRSDFVWKESKQIIRLKDKARENKTPMQLLWKEILDASSLAASIQEIYQSLSLNRIVSFQLDTANGPLNPYGNRPTRPMAHLGKPRNPEEAYEEYELLAKKFGLLLMDGEKKIISQLQVDLDPTTIAMVEFVRLCKPTMSLYQISQSNILSLSQVRKYAQHFTAWRRAIAIPPLHARDVYIMSPNCNLGLLPRASQHKAHRPTYLAMLAWLMRGGWVTQLCTFAYVVVWPEIIYEVQHQLEADELRGPKSSTPPGTKSASSSPSGTKDGPQPPRPARSSPTHLFPSRPSHAFRQLPLPTTVTEQIAEKARLERMATKAQREAAEKATAHARKPVPAPSASPSTNDAPHLARLEPYIILEAGRATGRDSFTSTPSGAALPTTRLPLPGSAFEVLRRALCP